MTPEISLTRSITESLINVLCFLTQSLISRHVSSAVTPVALNLTISNTHQTWSLRTEITARKQSLRRLCFYRCLSVHRGGMHGCSRGACMVAPGGGGACMVCSGGPAWLLWGVMHGCSGGHAWLLWEGHAWLLRGGACVVFSMRYGQ